MKNIFIVFLITFISCKEQPAPRPTPVTGGGAATNGNNGAAGSVNGTPGTPIANASSLTEFCAASGKFATVAQFVDHAAAFCANGVPTQLFTNLAGNYFSGNGNPSLVEIAPAVNDSATRTTTVFLATSLFIGDSAKQFAAISTLSDVNLSKFAKGLIANATSITVVPIQKNTASTVNGFALITNQWQIDASINNPLPTTVHFALENNYTKISDKTFSSTTHMIKPDETIEDIKQYNAMLTVDGKGVNAVVMRIRAKNSGQPSIVNSVVRDLVSKGVIASQKIAINGLQ